MAGRSAGSSMSQAKSDVMSVGQGENFTNSNLSKGNGGNADSVAPYRPLTTKYGHMATGPGMRKGMVNKNPDN
jgi:hypothetical protein